MINAFLLLLSAAFSVFCLKFVAVPYGAAALAWVATFATMGARSKRPLARRVFLATASIALSFGLIELFVSMAYNFGPKPAWRYSESFIQRDDVLGYAPARNKRILAQLTMQGHTLYTVTYTLDSNGRRVTPPANNRSECVVFFGDSYTFGEGLDDRETMPWLVGTQSGYSVVNLGFSGYGPHQMLAALQTWRAGDSLDCTPRAFVYQAIGEHASRAAGYAPWDQHGPQYLLTPTGLTSDGHFDDHAKARVRMQLTKSALFRHYLFYLPPLIQHRARLVSAIVETSRQRVAALYPDAAFEVIFWNDDTNASVATLGALQRAHLTVRLVSDILPGYPQQAAQYERSPYDRHPNAAADQLIARDVMKTILRK